MVLVTKQMYRVQVQYRFGMHTACGPDPAPNMLYPAHAAS